MLRTLLEQVSTNKISHFCMSIIHSINKLMITHYVQGAVLRVWDIKVKGQRF